jgi:hypothetical protein
MFWYRNWNKDIENSNGKNIAPLLELIWRYQRLQNHLKLSVDWRIKYSVMHDDQHGQQSSSALLNALELAEKKK